VHTTYARAGLAPRAAPRGSASFDRRRASGFFPLSHGARATRQVSVQATQRTLTEHASDKDAYAAKYAELKARNVRELDRFLMIAAKILTGAPRQRAFL
jgi:hypothetical protein